MLGLGIGEIVGSLVFGRITDKCSTRVTVVSNVLALTFSYLSMIAYGVNYDFNVYLATLMTFTMGV